MTYHPPIMGTENGRTEKGEANSRRAAERILNLLALLSASPRPLTLEQISQLMKGQYADGKEGRRTQFERDKRALREMGVPISHLTLPGSDAGKAAYFIDKGGYGDLYVTLDPEDLSVLQQAAAMVQIHQPWGKEAVLRLGGGAVEAAAPMVANVPLDDRVLPDLWTAVRRQCVASFTYGGKVRTVHPYGLISRNGAWYLSCHDTGRADSVVFRVDRIASGIALGEPGGFERPAGFSVADAMPADPKTFEGEGETCMVRISPTLAQTVVREVGEEAVRGRDEDGSVVVEVPCGHRPAFRTWLFAMVDRAEVLSPPAIRTEVVGWLRGMARGASA